MCWSNGYFIVKMGQVGTIQRLPSDGLALTIVEPKPKVKSLILKEEDSIQYPRMTIKDLLASVEVAKVRTICTIMDIDMDWPWFYFSCRKCNKKVVKRQKNIGGAVERPLFWCDTCTSDVSSVVARYWLHLLIMDATGESKLMLFDSFVQQIVGRSCAELLNGTYDEIEDPEALPDVIKNIVGKTYQFVVCVENDNIYRGNDVYKVAKVYSTNILNEEMSNESELPPEQSSLCSSEQVLMTTNSSEKSNTNMSIVSTPSSKRKEDVSDLPDQSSSNKKQCMDGLKVNIKDIADNDENAPNDEEANKFDKKIEEAGDTQLMKAELKKKILLKKVKVEK